MMKFSCYSTTFLTSLACLYSFLVLRENPVWIQLCYLYRFLVFQINAIWIQLCYLHRFFVFRINPVWIQLCYFLSISCVGFLLLKLLNPRNTLYRPKDLDVFFMSVSATTVSSMGTIEMEYFSNTQLVVLILLMLMGGEVFTSMLSLQLMKIKFKKKEGGGMENKVESVNIELSSTNPEDQIELGLTMSMTNNHEFTASVESGKFVFMGTDELKYSCIRYLNFVVLSYLLAVHMTGSSAILMYLILVPNAREVLKKKQIPMQTFAVYTTISTFANCGSIPTNENMVIFKRNSGLLLLIAPLVLLGNTLFPPCLRLLIWVLRTLTKRVEFDYIWKNPREIGYDHLLPSVHCLFLCLTVLGFIMVQFILFCCLEWHSDALDGLNSYQKLVAALFQSVNSRHAGESIVDLSILSPAILVLYVVMMYLPPYTSFFPIEDDGVSLENCQKGKKKRGLPRSMILSQLSYLVIFIILICITEREKMTKDPLNFNVFNIIIEVISAYGNVGFTTGYSCKHLLKPDSYCKDASYGFSGRWSNKGKLILILVMLFGRLKKFNIKGGRAWKLNLTEKNI